MTSGAGKASAPEAAASFTLVELLVVTAAIAVLAALLLPSLRAARAAGLGAQCQGQLHQLGVALENYRGDHADGFPFDWWQGSVTPPAGHAVYPTWDWVLLPYLGEDIRVFRCPADPRLHQRTYGYNAASNERLRGPWRLTPPWCQDACAPPCWRRDPDDAAPRPYGLDTFSAAAIERPSQTVALRELSTAWVYDYAVSSGSVTAWKLGQVGYWWHSIHHYTMNPCDNHAGGAFYLMVDGHVARRAAADMPAGDVARTGWWYYRKKF